MKIKDGLKSVIQYETGFKDFVLEVVVTEKKLEAWLFRDSYGVKDYMFGMSTKSVTQDHFTALAQANAESYTEAYERRYC